MIIYKPEIYTNDNNTIFSARIHVDHTGHYPETLWIKIPSLYECNLTKSSNPFITSLFLLASRFGEDINIKGNVSPRLIWGIQQYLQLFKNWYPNLYKISKIDAEFYEKKINSRNDIASSFSGGVDSFYTILRNNPTKPCPLPISYAFFIHGFDIPLNDPNNYWKIFKQYKSVLKQLDIELIPIATNIRDFLFEMTWEEVFGGPLAGIAFCFDNLFQYYLVPSAYDSEFLMKQGTDSRLVPLLATESTSLLLDAGGVSRTEKTSLIAKNPNTYNNLRVCWETIDGVSNCGNCEKCIRTMTELELLGKLDNYSTFKSPWSAKKIRRIRITTGFKRASWKHILSVSKRMNRLDIQFSILCSFLLSKIHPKHKK